MRLSKAVSFRFLHEQDLLTDKLKKYKTVILPNIALLSDGGVRSSDEVRA